VEEYYLSILPACIIIIVIIFIKSCENAAYTQINNTVYTRYVSWNYYWRAVVVCRGILLWASSVDLLICKGTHVALEGVGQTKELICFSKKVNITDIPQLCINGAEIDRVTTFKLLGVISSDLSWDSRYIFPTRSWETKVLY